MCQRIECKTCHKPTYRGCGQHIEQVLGDVPPGDRCAGHAREASAGGGGGWRKRLGLR